MAQMSEEQRIQMIEQKLENYFSGEVNVISSEPHYDTQKKSGVQMDAVYYDGTEEHDKFYEQVRDPSTRTRVHVNEQQNPNICY